MWWLAAAVAAIVLTIKFARAGTYLEVVMLAVDVLCCSWIWGRQGDITISSMCGLELRKPQPRLWARLLGGALNGIEAGHCDGAIRADANRARAALELLQP